MEALIDVLGPFTHDQPVHCGMWEGWSWWYDTGTDPGVNSGAGVYWHEDERPTQQEREQALAEVRELIAAGRVERPDTAPLELPNGCYYVWTGPLRAAAAFAHQPTEPPSLIWPLAASAIRLVPDRRDMHKRREGSLCGAGDTAASASI